MANNVEVMQFLCPNGGYVQRGSEYEGIEFIYCEPFSKEEYLAAFNQVDAWKAEQEGIKKAKRSTALAKLKTLGLDSDDLKALGL